MMRAPSRRAHVFAGIVFLFTVFYWSAMAILTSGNNGDLMYLESLYHHLFELHLPLRTFVFTEAFFFFPDVLIYFPLRFLLHSQAVATVVMMIVTLILGLVLISVCYRRVRGRAAPLEMASAGALSLILLSLSPRMLHLIFWPNHHSILILFALGFYLYALDFSGPWTYSRLGVLFSVMTLLLFSDGNAALEILIPVLLFILFFERERRNIAPAFTLVLATVAAGTALWYCKNHGVLLFHSARLIPAKAKWLDKLSTTPETIAALSSENWLYQFAIISILLMTLGSLRTRGPVFRDLDRFFALGMASTLGVVLALGRVYNVYTIRYFEIAFFFGAVWISLATLPRLFHHRIFYRVFPWVLITYMSVTVALLANVPSKNFFHSPLGACLRERFHDLPVHRGYAEFWAAKLVTFTTPYVVDQIDENYHRYLWMNAEAWYKGPHDFFIAPNKSEAVQAFMHYGPADKVFECDGDDHKILYYAKGLPAPSADPEDELDSENKK